MKVNNEKLIDDAISFIVDSEIDERDYCFNLGIGLMHEYVPEGVTFAADYIGLGRELLRAFEYELHSVLCCVSGNAEPKEWVLDLIEGNVRDVLVGIVTAIVSNYEVSFGIAVPLASIIVKRGTKKFCSMSYSQPCRRVVDILQEIKNEMMEISNEFNNIV